MEKVAGRTMDREEAVVLREDAEHWFEIEVIELPNGPQGAGWYITWFTLSSLLTEKRTGAGRRYYELWESQLPSHIRFLYLYATPRPRKFWKAMGFYPVYHPKDLTVPEDARSLLVKDLTGAKIRYAPYFEEEYEEILEFLGEGEVSYRPDMSKLRKASNTTDYLYHVTLLTRLDSIALHGLVPGRSENWPGYSGHARGRVFLTTEPAVNGWIHKVTYSAAIDTDRPVEEGFIPIVLRIPVQQVEEFLHEDEPGSRDVPEGESFYVESTVHPEELEVYTPAGWVHVDEVDVQEMLDHALEHAPRDRDDDDEEEYLLLDEYVFAPNPSTRRRVQGWGETTRSTIVHTCGRNVMLPECEGAEGFSILPTGKLPKSKKKKSKKKKGTIVHQGQVYQRMATPGFKKPTKEMLDFFKKRTQDHINGVVRCMKMLEGFKDFSTEELEERASSHDKDKYSDPDLILPYIWVTEYYRVKNEEGQSVPEDLQEQYEQANEATGKHVEENAHHPEAHSSLDDMSDLDLAEMVCDWQAMADELGQGSARGWADDNVGSKWEFSEDATRFIYDTIEWLEEKGKK